jgi:hypothetical protein
MTNNVLKIAKVCINELSTQMLPIIFLFILLIHSNGQINAQASGCDSCLGEKDTNTTCIVEANKCLTLICNGGTTHWYKNTELQVASSNVDNKYYITNL